MKGVVQRRWQPGSDLLGKFCECLPVLAGKRFSLRLRGRVCAACVRGCLVHGSETQPVKAEHELTMNRTEMSVIGWMCGVELGKRGRDGELGELLGLEPVSLMVGERIGMVWTRLNEGMIVAGSDVVWRGKLRELDREDARRGPGGIVLRITWKVWVCPRGMRSLGIDW